MFSIKRKSGTVRDSCHGVKTKRGSKMFLDVPFVGSKCLLDDIHKVKISIVPGPDPFNYKIESYDISVLNPGQPNRAKTILNSKFYRDGAGRIEGFGLKVFP